MMLPSHLIETLDRSYVGELTSCSYINAYYAIRVGVTFWRPKYGWIQNSKTASLAIFKPDKSRRALGCLSNVFCAGNFKTASIYLWRS